MASEDLKIVIGLVDNISSQLEALNAKVDSFARESKRKVEETGKAFESLKEYAKKAVEALAMVGISVGLEELGKSLLEAATDAEQLKVRLDTFTNNHGNEAFEALSQFAIKMGISIKDASTAFIHLSAMGIQPTEARMRGLVGAAEALDGKFNIGTFDSISRAIGMMGESAKMAQQGLRMLSREGINIYPELKKSLGLSSTELDNFAKSGKSAADLQKAAWDALIEKYGSAADKMALTWQNTWQSIKDAFELFEEAVMNSGAFQYLEQKLQELLKWSQTLAGQHQLQLWAQQIGGAFLSLGGVLMAFINVLAIVYNAVVAFVSSVSAVFWRLVSAVEEVFTIIGSVVLKIVSVVSNAVSAISPNSALAKNLKSAVNTAKDFHDMYKAARDYATESANTAGQTTVNSFKHMLGDLENIYGNMKTIYKGVEIASAEPNYHELGKKTDWPLGTKDRPDTNPNTSHAKTAHPKTENLQKEIDDHIKLLELMAQEEQAQAKLDYDSGKITEIQYEQKLIDIRRVEIQVLKEASALQVNNGTKYIELKTKIINLEDQNAQALKKVNQLLQEQQINLINTQVAETKLNEAEGKINNVQSIQQEINSNKELIAAYKKKLETMKQTDPEYSRTVTQITNLVNANKQLQQSLLVQTGTFQQGVVQGFQNYLKSAQTAFQQGQTLAQNTAQSMAQAFGTSFFDIVTGKLNNLRQVWSQFFASIAQQIAQMIAQMMIMNALKSLGGMLGFANGGVVNGLQIGAFAGGGIIGSPTLALVGEGAHREAIVPLPDGKSIPVSMKGGDSGGGVNIVNVLDNAVFSKWANTLAGKKTIRNIMGKQNKSALDWG